MAATESKLSTIQLKAYRDKLAMLSPQYASMLTKAVIKKLMQNNIKFHPVRRGMGDNIELISPLTDKQHQNIEQFINSQANRLLIKALSEQNYILFDTSPVEVAQTLRGKELDENNKEKASCYQDNIGPLFKLIKTTREHDFGGFGTSVSTYYHVEMKTNASLADGNSKKVAQWLQAIKQKSQLKLTEQASQEVYNVFNSRTVIPRGDYRDIFIQKLHKTYGRNVHINHYKEGKLQIRNGHNPLTVAGKSQQQLQQEIVESISILKKHSNGKEKDLLFLKVNSVMYISAK